MAYMNQEKKKTIAPVVKKILKKYGVRGRLSVRHHSTLVLKISDGSLDLIGDYVKVVNDPNGIGNYFHRQGQEMETPTYIDVNPYHYQNHFSGKSLEFLKEIFSAMNNGNHDNSDSQTDYFDVGWYNEVHIGSWENPYINY